MGDAARAPKPPPVAGAGEPEREMNGLSTEEARSLLPSSSGDGVLVPEECDDSADSAEPSVLGIEVRDSGDWGERGLFPEPGVN